MKIICQSPAVGDCPKKLHICCGTCEQKDTCENCCDCITDPNWCPDAEVVADELVQFQAAVPDIIQSITAVLQAKKQLDEQENKMKQQLKAAMETYGVKSFENDQIKMVYAAPTTRNTIDSARLKKDHPDIAEQYTKTSNVSASIRVAVK